MNLSSLSFARTCKGVLRQTPLTSNLLITYENINLGCPSPKSQFKLPLLGNVVLPAARITSPALSWMLRHLLSIPSQGADSLYLQLTAQRYHNSEQAGGDHRHMVLYFPVGFPIVYWQYGTGSEQGLCSKTVLQSNFISVNYRLLGKWG